MSLEQDRELFLRTLFDGLPGYIEVRALPIRGGAPRQSFCKGIGEAMDAIARDFEAGLNQYVGMATRGDVRNRETDRISGGKDNLVACRALWVDRDDLLAEGAREEYHVELEQFPFAPSMRVDSGGGEHTYFLLEEPLDLMKPENVCVLECTLKGLADVLHADPAATDASRILRLAGTMNLPTPEKQTRGRTEAPCRLFARTNGIYSLQDFEAFTHRGTSLVRAAPRTTAPPAGDLHKFQHPHRHDALKRHAAFLRKGGLSVAATEAALLVFNEQRCDPPKPEDEVRQIARWAACVNVGERNALELEPRPAERQGDGYARWLRSQLEKCLRPLNSVEEMMISAAEERLAPRFPSSIENLQFYGLVIIVAEGGVGKSVLGVASALEACASEEWHVVYFNAEIDGGEMSTRVGRYRRSMQRQPDMSHFRVYSVNDGSSVRRLVERCIENVQPDRRLLVVLDSANSIAELCCKGTHQMADLEELRRLTNWATQVRKHTGGEVAFLLISETNASGGVKGRKGFFSADVVVRLVQDAAPDYVTVNCEKSRSSQRGELGVFRRDWRKGRFVK